MRIIFACGGTAGHINPALAVAGRIKELMPDSEFLFIGAVGQMESDLVPRAGYRIETVRVRGLSREKTLGGFFHNISAAWHLVRSTIKARKIIKRFKDRRICVLSGFEGRLDARHTDRRAREQRRSRPYYPNALRHS